MKIKLGTREQKLCFWYFREQGTAKSKKKIVLRSQGNTMKILLGTREHEPPPPPSSQWGPHLNSETETVTVSHGHSPDHSGLTVDIFATLNVHYTFRGEGARCCTLVLWGIWAQKNTKYENQEFKEEKVSAHTVQKNSFSCSLIRCLFSRAFVSRSRAYRGSGCHGF